MTWLRETLRKAARRVFPWPSRHERKAAIRAARGSREHSQAQASQARGIERQILRIADDDHLAAAIVDQIRRRP